MSKAHIQDALNKLQSVLCDPTGHPCFAGSDADRAEATHALNTLRRLLAPCAPKGGPVAWRVQGRCVELFQDLEEAHKYAMTIGARVENLYTTELPA